jgi:hypothetical protein
MLREALRYPTRGDDPAESLLVGGGLHLLVATFPVTAPVAFVLVVGYLVRVLGRAADEPRPLGERPPPTFREVAAVVRAGAAGIVVAAVYLVVPAALLAVTTYGALGRDVGAEALGPGLIVGLSLGSLATLALATALAGLLPAALAAYAVTGRLRAAVHVRTLARALRNPRYFVAVSGAGVVLVLAAVAAVALGRVVVGFFLAFYLEVAAAALAVEGVAGPVGAFVGSERGPDAPGRAGAVDGEGRAPSEGPPGEPGDPTEDAGDGAG